MSKWIDCKIGDLCSEIYSGGTPSTAHPEYWNGKYNWLSSGETSNRYIIKTEKTITQEGVNSSSTKLAKFGSLVIASAGQGKTRGQASILKCDAYINQSIIALVSKPELLDITFLFYNMLLRYEELRVRSDASSTRGSITTDMLKKLPILLPDLATQKYIADILSVYDNLIEANNHRIELLEKSAQELYQEWFVRFRFPGRDKVKFENGLPKGWDVVKLGDYVDIKGGKRLPEGKSLCGEKTEHPYIRIRDISSSKFVSLNESFEYIDNDTFDIINRFTVSTKDILISIVGTIGAIACVGKSLEGANLTENCVKLINVNYFTSDYLYHFLNSDAGKGTIKAGIVGATQPKLPLYNLKRIKLLKPQIGVINKFTMLIEPINQEIMNLMDYNSNLVIQRDLLLPRLMSGKLEV